MKRSLPPRPFEFVLRREDFLIMEESLVNLSHAGFAHAEENGLRVTAVRNSLLARIAEAKRAYAGFDVLQLQADHQETSLVVLALDDLALHQTTLDGSNTKRIADGLDRLFIAGKKALHNNDVLAQKYRDALARREVERETTVEVERWLRRVNETAQNENFNVRSAIKEFDARISEVKERDVDFLLIDVLEKFVDLPGISETNAYSRINDCAQWSGENEHYGTQARIFAIGIGVANRGNNEELAKGYALLTEQASNVLRTSARTQPLPTLMTFDLTQSSPTLRYRVGPEKSDPDSLGL